MIEYKISRVEIYGDGIGSVLHAVNSYNRSLRFVDQDIVLRNLRVSGILFILFLLLLILFFNVLFILFYRLCFAPYARWTK